MHSSAPRIKICGLTRYDDAALAADSGAWGLGFIFSDASPRQCPPATAEEIIRRLDENRYEVEKVGVFLNEQPDVINRVASDIGLTVAQLHGNESPEESASVEVRVLKAIQNLELDRPGVLDAYSCWLLMDAPQAGGRWGGTGHTGDWQMAKKIARDYPLFLAGNIGLDNVIQALQAVSPMGIDLSSSIEKDFGVKDHDRMRRFFRLLADAGYMPRPV